MPLLTLSTMRDWLDIPDTDTAQNDLLTEIEARTVDRVEAWTGRTLLTPTAGGGIVQEYRQGDGTPTVVLSSNVVTPIGVATIVEIRESLYDDWTTTVPDTELRAYDQGEAHSLQRRKLDRINTAGDATVAWPLPFDRLQPNLRVHYVPGYDNTTVPGDLAQALLEIVAATYRGRPRQRIPTAREEQIPLVIPPSAKEALHLWWVGQELWESDAPFVKRLALA